MKPLVEILLVEDNPADVKLTMKLLSEFRTPFHLSTAADGVEAMSFLKKEGHFRGAPRPDIILLDLNLPRKDGREVLKEVKSDPKLMSIPVLILTTSNAHTDLRMSYQLHANGYIQKPVDLESYRRILASLEAFWLQAALLPPLDQAS